MYYTENCICPHEVPRINRCTAVEGITRQPLRINRGDAAVLAGRETTIELRLIETDALFIFGGRAIRHVWRASAARDAVTRRDGGRRKDPIISHVVERARGARR